MAEEHAPDMAATPDDDFSRVIPPPAAPGDPIPDEFMIDLDEYCARKSGHDNRVEMIAAFHYIERAAGRAMDMPSAYEARFGQFGSRVI